MKKDNTKSMAGRNFFDLMGFSPNRRKRPYMKTVTYYDREGGTPSMSVIFSAPEVCGAKELDVFLSLIYESIGENAINILEEEKSTYAVYIDLKKMAKFISTTNRSTINERRGIVESLMRVSNITIQIIENGGSGVKRFQDKWIYNVTGIDGQEIDEDFLQAKVLLNKTVVKDALAGIGFNLGHLLSIKSDRAKILYGWLQAHKHKNKKTGKFEYNDSLNHNKIVEVLELQNLDIRTQKNRIKSILKELGLNYKFYKNRETNKTYWKKIIAVKSEIGCNTKVK